ncbi:Beta-glucosidase, lactase phlorizinhydrolase [Handroanthus impetiginosus]|uniref:Beta-glucosidase, lactase phlorizinhydrolase n=1 Tax=Handroanthus impetiginosus TaxID=429701 RepID=A0A2G9HKG8_9LAMI|nr:Beta-glucosidase, lactase phlorizinhydrolase [Handroanthus impetiginosus]
MARLSSIIVPPIFLLLLLHMATAILGAEHYSRADFPADFVFGSGTTAAQYEGAAFEDGRTPSIWDTFAHSGHVGGATGDVACDGYHKYKEDIRLMVDTDLDAFRISISWSRLIPNGRGPINTKGLQYYNNLINELISNGIQPHVTLIHLDLPQALADEYGGWLSRKIVRDFVEFADVCFKVFGDRVLYWTTINEANVAALGGYDEGIVPPGRCSIRSICPDGDSTTEPYIVAHSAAAKLYREKYKATQNGKVGLSIYTLGYVPYTNSTEDVMATQRAREFYIGWILNPLIFGDYPDIMKNRAQRRLPAFTKKESEQIKGSLDFIGLNHYFAVFIKDDSSRKSAIKDFYADLAVNFEFPESPAYQYPVMPWALEEMLEYLKQVYGNPPIYIQENGQMTRRNGTLNDTARVEYIHAYIGAVLDAVRNGSNTIGYFVWTLLDCLELWNGYETSYGLYYVDLDDKELIRYPKLSAHWYSNFLKGKSTTPDPITQVKEKMTISLRQQF